MKNIKTKILMALMFAIQFYSCKKLLIDVSPQGGFEDTKFEREKWINKILL